MRRLYLSLLLIPMLASCSKHELDTVEYNRTFLNISAPEQTRTVLGEGTTVRPVLWKAGDEIIVNCDHVGTVGPDDDGKSSARIAIETFIAGPYDVFYPREAMNADGTVTVPEIQSYTSGTFDGKAAFMAGYSESDDVQLRNMFGFIRLKLTSTDNCTISSLMLSSKSAEPMSGIFNIDCQNATLTPVTAKDFIKMDGVEIRDGSADIILAVLPGTYSGFRLRIVSDATDGNNLMQASITAETLVITAGKLVDMGTVAFDPKERATEILSASDFLAFMTAAAEGDYSAWVDARSSEVLLGNDIDCTGLTLPQPATFDGVLNGQGYSLKNLHLEDGLFGNVTGTIKNLTFDSTCSFVFPVSDTTEAHYRGMLCRQSSGTIIGCVSHATCPPAELESLYRRFFGTFVGYSTGTVSNCVNYTSYDITVDSQLGAPNMGCIVGNMANGVCRGCINYGDFRFKTLSTASNIYIGGVAGAVSGTIEGMVNYGDVTMEFPGAAKVAPILGGVAATQTSGNNVGSSNHGAVTLICPEATTTIRPYVGGLIGTVSAGSIDTGVNTGAVVVEGNFASYGTAYTHVGGVIGLAGSSSALVTIANTSNSGTISFSNASSSKDLIRVAGLVGGLYGSMNSCTNSGLVSVTETGGSKSYVAGLVSHLAGNDCLVSSCVNSGNVNVLCTNASNGEFCVGGLNALSTSCTIKDCANEGDIIAECGSINIIGGISAYMYGTATHKISNTINSGAISVNVHSGKTSNIGGITGAGGAVSGAQYYISTCRNTGKIDLKLTGLHRVGGIVGYGNLTSVEGSVNSGDIEIGNDETFQSAAYQYIGGILGTAHTSYNYKTLVGCTNTGDISILTNAKVRLGGIMAYANVAVDNMGCSNTGRLHAKNITDGSNIGGIVGYCNKNLSGCISKCDIVNESTSAVTVGGLVGSFHNTSGLTFSGSQVDCSISSASTTISPACVLGQQLNADSAGQLGTDDSPISVTPTTTLNGKAISNPITIQEAVGDIKTESLLQLTNVVIFTPSTGLCSYLESQTRIPGTGATASLVLTIGDEPCTIESTNYGWIRFSDSNPKEAEAGAIVNVSYNALGSFGPSGRQCTVRVTGKNSGKFQDVVFTQPSADEWVRTLGAYELSARWQQTTAYKGKVSSKWVDYGYLPAHSGNGDTAKNGGFLSLVRTDKNEALAPIQRSYNSIAAYATCIGEGDYWLVTIPRVTCSKDTWFDFLMTMTANAKAPKYFIFEYWDGENWVSREDHLFTAEEDSSIKYSFQTPGTVIEMAGEYVTYCENFCPGQDLSDGMLFARLRAVGKYTADGSTLNVTNTTAAECGWAPSAFTALYVAKYEGARPQISKKVFFVGNSFTYYYNTITKLQQIAWSQGLEVNAGAFLKGGVTYDTHLQCRQCLRTIAEGGYDCAIIQGSSKLEPDYGRDSVSMRYVMDDAQAMVAELHKYSPSCKVYHEMTWATQNNAENRITAEDLAAHSMSDNLTNRMAILDEYIGIFCDSFLWNEPQSGISPVGRAFELGRKQTPDINLYAADNHHENSYGAYLKACVNCMVLTGHKLEGTVPTMDGLPTSDTDRLQSVAVTAYEQYVKEKQK